MSIDEFINNDSVGTPAGLALTPTPESTKHGDDARAPHSTASAIPIKTRKESAQHLVPQSVPVAVHHPRIQDEFGYIPRHPRKTSIDETSRRVSWQPLIHPAWVSWFHFLGAGPPDSLHNYEQS
jgi:GATA-binding protein, other eukaryote